MSKFVNCDCGRVIRRGFVCARCGCLKCTKCRRGKVCSGCHFPPRANADRLLAK